MENLGEVIDGLPEGIGNVGFGRGIVGEGEGDGSEAAEEVAEKDAGATVGDGARMLLEEGAEDVEDGGGNFGAFEGGQGAAEVEPVAEWDLAVAEGRDGGMGRVMLAEDVVGGGAATAAFAVGEAVAALHGEPRDWWLVAGGSKPGARSREPGFRYKGKGRLLAAFFVSYPLLIEYRVQRLSKPTLFGVIGL